MVRHQYLLSGADFIRSETVGVFELADRRVNPLSDIEKSISRSDNIDHPIRRGSAFYGCNDGRCWRQVEDGARN